MTTLKDSESQNKSALLYMIAAVVLYSTLQIAFSFGGASNAPFLFVALVYSGSLICNVVYLYWVYPKEMNRGTLKIIRENLWSPTLGKVPIIGAVPVIFWVTFSHIDYVLLAFSLRYVDEAIAAVLIETEYIFIIFLMMKLFNKEDSGVGEKDRYEKFTAEKWFLFGVALVGVGFVITSQSSAIDNAVGELFTVAALGGVGLVLAAAFCAAMVWPATQKWGADVSHIVNNKDNEIFYTIVANSIGRAISVPILFVIGVLSGETIQDLGGVGVLLAVVFGLIGPGMASMFFRISLAKTSNLGIGALSYLIPAVALIWLELASLIDIPHVDWLIIGIIAVITANLLLNFKAEIRGAYKALIIALWVCGMAVYLHDGFPLSSYAEVVGVAATLFILILVFRADRMVRRTTDEENSVFLLYNKLSTLARKGGISEDAKNQICQIDEHRKPEQLRTAYRNLKDYFQTTREQHPEYDDDKLDELEAAVDSLAHSKQQGENFGELIALGFITFIMTCALLLFKPPGLFGWDGLFMEISAFLLAAVTVFLFASIFDLQYDRHDAVLRKEKGNDFHSVAFDDAADRGGERWVSVTVCAAIAFAYIWLFLGKWVS